MSRPPRVVALVQARVGSTRLPGKVLLELGGRSMLAWVVSAARAARRLDAVVVATSSAPGDEQVAEAARALGAEVFRGSEADVLERFSEAARAHRAEVVVRLTADCPFLDPELIDDAVERFLEARVDYASNGLVEPYPRGLDVEVLKASVLHEAAAEASLPHQRAHVTAFVYEHPERYRLLPVPTPPALAAERWTVDTAEDLAFAREVAARLGSGAPRWREVAAVLEREPALRALNAAVRQKPLGEG